MSAADPMAALAAAVAACPPRVPGPGARVHKDEASYSFATPFSPGGLYVNLTTWQVRGRERDRGRRVGGDGGSVEVSRCRTGPEARAMAKTAGQRRALHGDAWRKVNLSCGHVALHLEEWDLSHGLNVLRLAWLHGCKVHTWLFPIHSLP